MMLALAPGNEFKIQVEGEKEDEALEALSNIVNNDFV